VKAGTPKPGSIWAACAGESHIRLLSVEAWRAVESQHQIATRKLVQSDAEQKLLEELIDSVKPPDRSRGSIHYLLFTPFRYPPLPHGSRFGTRTEPRIWYGSETAETVFAEVAYYRLLFIEGSTAELEPLQTDLTSFRIVIRTARGVDLSLAPFDRFADVIASPVSYEATQALGREMREAGVHATRYPSARDRDSGINVAAFEPIVFGRRQPKSLETWHCTATRELVEFVRRDYFKPASLAYDRQRFLMNGVLPAPAI
jgi:hypothetical protein